MSLPKPLIQPAELLKCIEDPAVVVVDCRHRLLDPDAGERLFREGHLPGARHAHLDRDLSRVPSPSEGRHPLPGVRAFSLTLERLGISNDTAVVVYDDAGAAVASRLWWLLRWVGHQEVAVLDGGMPAWQSSGYPLERESIDVPRGAYSIEQTRDDWVVDTSEVAALRADGIGSLVDVRSAERFKGIAEPIDPVAGHVPGAVNLPGSDLLDRDGKLAGAEAIRRSVTEALSSHETHDIVAMCGSGVTACQLLLAMESAGLGTGRLYTGSWSEWIRDPSRPIATVG